MRKLGASGARVETQTGRLIQLSSQEGLMTAQRRLLGLVGAGALALAFAAIGAAPAQGASNATVSILHGVPDATVDVYANGKALRSEERRVGKEGEAGRASEAHER